MSASRINTAGGFAALRAVARGYGTTTSVNIGFAAKLPQNGRCNPVRFSIKPSV
jgi:hypothetical protein